jgi:integrase
VPEGATSAPTATDANSEIGFSQNGRIIWLATSSGLKSGQRLRSGSNPCVLRKRIQVVLLRRQVKLIYATMGQLTKYAMKWGYLTLNPFAGKVGQERRIDPPPGSTKRLHKAAQLTPAQISELLLHLGSRERAAVDFSAWLEPRGSETFALKWMDLDLTAAVVKFSRGIDAGRITKGKTSASNTEMPLPDEVVRSLLEWQSITPYNRPGDWVFASPQKNGMMPISRYGVMRYYIQPIARKLGLPHVTWYSFRHSLNALAKECISPEGRQIMLRHGRTSTE